MLCSIAAVAGCLPSLVLAQSSPEASSPGVVVEIAEGLSAEQTWDFEPPRFSESWRTSQLAFVGLPHKYSERAIVVDRANPSLLRAACELRLPAGKYRLLLRSQGPARVTLDGQIVAETPFPPQRASGHEDVPEAPPPVDDRIPPLGPGYVDRLETIAVDGRPCRLQLEAIVGGRNRRLELGELVVAIAREDQPLAIVAPHEDVPAAHADSVSQTGEPFDKHSWDGIRERLQATLVEQNRQRRVEINRELAPYWERRHDLARQIVGQLPPLEIPESPHAGPHPIDRLIAAAHPEFAAAGPIDDLAFLRRVTLDVAGQVPSLDEIRGFLADAPEVRRTRAIDRLLNDPRWADHWTAYWQDVLAENPGVLKPQLNNTGPFRWWLHESFSDHKPLDRMVTELVRMEGSIYEGAPGAFAIASQNDAPLAAKAHVLVSAFLGVDLRCARCHDAPYHPYKQQDTFALAALLARAPQQAPASSTVPLKPGARQPLVAVTLQPGTPVEGQWPLDAIASADLPEGLEFDAADSRDRLAAILTSPGNVRFAQMLANRFWHRYLGRGIVDATDDWHASTNRNPALLDFLARELAAHGYDARHLARLIFTSQTYQLASGGANGRGGVGPVRRRLTAEQLVDSLYAVAGQPLDSEPLCLDPENRRPYREFLNLGQPVRAWQMTSLSNERDRPALALPMAQTVVDLLEPFGWRPSRPDPITERNAEPTALQPLVLANGSLVNRLTRLTDEHALTASCLEAREPEALVEEAFLRVLCRLPDADERLAFVDLLTPGFEQRIVTGVDPAPRKTAANSYVSWSNHLSPEATLQKLELEKRAREGDPPTRRLQADWRERMEDLLWTLATSPEFVFVP